MVVLPATRAHGKSTDRHPLRILHVVQCYAPAVGGTEHVVQQLSEHLARGFGDRVTVFTTNCANADEFVRSARPSFAEGWEEVGGVPVRRFPVRRWHARLVEQPARVTFRLRLAGNQWLRTLYGGPVIPGLASAIRSCEADLVAASSFPLLHMYTALRAARRSHRPCVLIGGLHPAERWGYDRPMIYEAIRRADHYVAYTPFEARWVERQGVPAERIAVIGLGVDPDPFQDVDAERARSELAFTSGPVVGFVGQLAPHKGIDRLVSAMEHVWKEHPDANLLVAGARTPHASALQARVLRLDEPWRSRVRWIENFDDSRKPVLFAACDVIAYPSRFESFGLVFLEAWAAGLPVVGCRGSAVEDVIRDEVDGLLVDVDSVTGLAAALSRLLRNPTERANMGAAGRARVLEHHRWETIAARFREVYVRVLEGAAVKGEIRA
jgi:glycosyltransferase involved in cell wall biosynthesis